MNTAEAIAQIREALTRSIGDHTDRANQKRTGALTALDSLEAEVERNARKVKMYDNARATVKIEGNTRAYYVLRAEAAEAKNERYAETVKHLFAGKCKAEDEIERLRAVEDALSDRCLALEDEIELLRAVVESATGVASEIKADLPHKCLICIDAHVDGCPVPVFLAVLAVLAALTEGEGKSSEERFGTDSMGVVEGGWWPRWTST